MPAEATIRDKYHKCFTCNLTGITRKIYKIRTRLKIKVQALFTTNTNLFALTQGWPKPTLGVSMFLHLAGLFRGARRYEVASLNAGDHDLDIAIGKNKTCFLPYNCNVYC